MNDVGEPCAGEPHARFDGEGLETEDLDHGGDKPQAYAGNRPARTLPAYRPQRIPPRQPLTQPTSELLTGRGTADMLKAVPEVGIMIGCGLLVGWRVEAGLGDAVAAVGLLLLLRLALEWMGIYLGLIVTNPDLAGLVVYPLVFPLTALSTAFVPAETMPSWLGAIAAWNPLTATVDATRQLFGSPVTTGPSWVSGSATLMAVLWPLVLTATFMPLSIRRYRRMRR